MIAFCVRYFDNAYSYVLYCDIAKYSGFLAK